jgi:hypothetical protein
VGRSGLIPALAVWVGASALGIALVVLLPEDWLGGGRLFSLGAEHGPAPSDAVGLVLVLAGWAVWLRALWRRRARMPRRPALLVALASLLATVGCLAAFAAGHELSGLVSGLAAVAGQLALGGMTRPERRSARGA